MATSRAIPASGLSAIGSFLPTAQRGKLLDIGNTYPLPVKPKAFQGEDDAPRIGGNLFVFVRVSPVNQKLTPAS
jgi:hypothetical protein